MSTMTLTSSPSSPSSASKAGSSTPRSLRCMTFNTFLAPTMYDRFRRRHLVHQALHDFDQLGVDLLVCQEFNSFRAGPFTYLLFYILVIWLKFTHPAFIAAIEYLMVTEGLILPLVLVDNKKETIDYARQHTHFQYIECSSAPSYFVDAGIIIFSRLPLNTSNKWDRNFKRDVGNAPGVLAVDIECKHIPVNQYINSAPQYKHNHQNTTANGILRVVAVHLVPSLPSTSIPYRLVNLSNALLGLSVNKLRAEQLQLIRENVHDSKLHTYNQYGPHAAFSTIVLGDFNVIHASTEGDEVLEALSSFNVALPDGTVTVLEPERQIDFILVDKHIADYTNTWKKVKYDIKAQNKQSSTTEISQEETDDLDEPLHQLGLHTRSAKKVILEEEDTREANAISSTLPKHRNTDPYPYLTACRIDETYGSDHWAVEAELFIPS